MTPTNACGDILWLDTTDSTNSELRRRIGTLDNLSIVASESQSGGRGQGDHVWISAPGQNLTFSVLLRFEGLRVAARDAAVINGFIVPAIRELLSEEGVDSWVKQPNDIWVGGRKICGILVENILRGGMLSETIVGVGLNLNQTAWPEDLPNPVSLAELTGKRYPPEETLRRISFLCKRNWNMFRRSLMQQQPQQDHLI